jgi:hypothetical protein
MPRGRGEAVGDRVKLVQEGHRFSGWRDTEQLAQVVPLISARTPIFPGSWTRSWMVMRTSGNAATMLRMMGLIPAGPGAWPGASGMSSHAGASTASTRSGFCSLNARYSVSTATRSARSCWDRSVVADAEELGSMFAGNEVPLSGRLRIDLPTEFARSTILPALPTFMDRYPDIELELSSTDRRVDLIQEGMDCVLRAGSIGDETLVVRTLGTLPMVNAASPPTWRGTVCRARWKTCGPRAIVEVLPDLRPRSLPISIVVAHRHNLSRRPRLRRMARRVPDALSGPSEVTITRWPCVKTARPRSRPNRPLCRA